MYPNLHAVAGYEWSGFGGLGVSAGLYVVLAVWASGFKGSLGSFCNSARLNAPVSLKQGC